MATHFATGAKNAVEDAFDRTLRATGKGDLADRLKAVREKNAIINEKDLPWLDKVKEGNINQAFTEIWQGGKTDWERLNVLAREKPQEARKLFGDIVEYMGKATPGQETVAGMFSADTFLTNFNRLSKEAKETLAFNHPTVLKAMEDQALASRAMRERDKAGNPSGTASAGAQMGQAATLINDTLRGIKTLMGASAASAGLSNKRFIAYNAGRGPTAGELITDRMLNMPARGAGLTIPEQDTPEARKSRLEIRLRGGRN
jgi:hypothetical protein